jgi:hypothetical protein
MNPRNSYTITRRCCWPLRPGHSCMRAVRHAGQRCVHHAALVVPAQPPAEPTPAVAHPTHYNAGTIEVIAVIEDWNLNFNEGNVVKYVARARLKGERLEDLQKARQYIDFEIARVTRGGA